MDEQPRINFCPHCGSKLVDQTKFCTNCGEKIIKENYNNLDEKEVKKYSNIQNSDNKNTRSKSDSDETRGDKIFKFLVMFIFGAMFFVMLYYYIMDYQAKYQTNDDSASSDIATGLNQLIVNDDNVSFGKIDYHITPYELYHAYEENAFRADNTYKGKILSISGRVNSIRTNLQDQVEIYLDVDDSIIAEIRCIIQRKDRSKAQNIRKGMQINLVGEGKGKIILYPVIQNCIFN